jgi:ketosteroid isomerase-like protein
VTVCLLEMEPGLLAAARAGLEAWQRGDVEALEPLLDPEVELLWWEPGEWDCHGREEVLTLLRERARGGAGGEVELLEAGEGAIVVARTGTVADGPAAGLRPATLVVFRGGRAVSMRQFRSREEALAAAR